MRKGLARAAQRAEAALQLKSRTRWQRRFCLGKANTRFQIQAATTCSLWSKATLWLGGTFLCTVQCPMVSGP